MQYTSVQPMILLDALSQLSSNSSKNTLKSWIKEGRVEVDGEVVTHPSLELKAHQKITVGPKKKILPGNLYIIYEDRDFIVINKPSGLLSVSSAFEKEETAHAILKRHFSPKPVFVVHRLDQDTSGVMLFALNQQALLRLKDIFVAHDIERLYTAVVEGKLLTAQGTWQSFQVEDANYKVHETEDEEQGEIAITHFRTLTTTSRHSLLEFRLETGRKNQIRVHCSSAGHPVVGDKKYGSSTNPIKRLALHAHFLSFIHPFSKKLMKFEAPIPVEFHKLFKNQATVSLKPSSKV